MPDEPEASTSRNARRKSRTRAALVQAAQQLLSEGDDADASIQAIADRADVGFGSFYNHFASKAELFDAAVADAFTRYTAWRDAQLGPAPDPVRRFAMNIRLTGRFSAAQPEIARILTHQIAAHGQAGPGLETALRPDLLAAVAALHTSGATGPSDTDVTVIAATGAVAAVLREVVRRGPAEQARLADALTRDLLRMLGAPWPLIDELLDVPCP
ncbi:TetR/AcrR family transcriptional regulator [Solwaraspora sp. WMMB335]|uniref:TetR/AcrR family transcriptional regulator n=1 Tax=Solwaraspora sp. WMMB335 TaxID=3404118 RepID=UPI003B952951